MNDCLTDPIFLNFSESRLNWQEEVGGENKEGGMVEGEVCNSIIHNVQFKAKYHMIS